MTHVEAAKTRSLQGKRLLITGAGGDLGTLLTPALMEEGLKLRLVTRRPLVSTAFGASSKNQPEVVYSSIQSGADVEWLKGVDFVLHLAWQSYPAAETASCLTELHSNIIPFLVLAEACLKEKIPFIFASSGGAIYGNAEVFPTPEDAPWLPCSQYGVGKVFAERSLHFLGYKNQFPFVILRPGNILLEKKTLQELPPRPFGLLDNILYSLKTEHPLTLFGPEVSRDYITGAAFTEAVLLTLSHFNELQGEAYNLSGLSETKNVEVLRRVEEISGKRISFETRPPRSFDVQRSFLDDRKFRSKTGFKTAFDLSAVIEGRLRDL